MKLHRFYINELHNKYGKITLDHELWINHEPTTHQWLRVLRFKVGDKLVLFNDETEKLYQISQIEDDRSVKLIQLSELERNMPKKNIYLFWAVLKKDKNDWVIQKGTELGVHKFVPIIAERSEKTDINIERANKIIIEASEQCGRSDIPEIREPIHLKEVFNQYQDLEIIVCQQGSNGYKGSSQKLGLIVGPEGGWSPNELTFFESMGANFMGISDFTLRAETASVVAVSRIL